MRQASQHELTLRFSPLDNCLPTFRSDAAQIFQFVPPNLCFQSLITPGGNSRLPTPVRRQASGHISSKKWSSRNSSLWETWSASTHSARSAAIFKSSMSVATSCSLVFMTTPLGINEKLHPTTDVAVSGITKRRISSAAVVRYLVLIPIRRYNDSDGGPNAILGA